MKKMLLAAMFLCCAGAGWAQNIAPITIGSGFLRECGPKIPSADPDIRIIEEGGAPVVNTGCSMYIFGILEGIDSDADLLERQDGKSHRFICVPRGVVAGDMRDVVLKYIQKDPKFFSDFKTNRITSLALSAAYPCQAEKSPQP
jgi:hypothetical protein